VNSRHARFLAGALAAAALAAAAGCDGTVKTPAGDGGGVRTAAELPEDGVLVRYKFEKDRLQRYELEFRAVSEGDGEIHDTVRSAIYQLCLGPAEDSPAFQKLNIVRREVERLKKETDRQGRKLPAVTAARTVEPDLSGNHGYDRERNKGYYPFDDRGVLGRNAENPWHRVWYDSLVYLLPVLPPGKVRPGAVWSTEIPVYAGAEYFYAMGGYRRGNDFNLSVTGKVERIYRQGGELVAQLSWNCAGTFDTDGFRERFPPAFHQRLRHIHDVRGSGQGVFSLDRGVMLSKSGQATITMTTRVLVTRPGDEGKPGDQKWEESVERHVTNFRCRLLSDREPDPKPAAR
jgi:hypothetical protein